MPWVIFQLLPQITDVEAEAVYGIPVFGTPHPIQQVFVRADVARSLAEGLQKLELHRRERYRRPTFGNKPPLNVNRHVSQQKSGRRGPARASQHRLNRRGEVHYPDRLNQVLVRPHIQAADDVILVVETGEDDKGEIADGADEAASLEAVHIRDGQVEDDELRVSLKEGSQGCCAVRSDSNGEAQVLQPRGPRLRFLDVVLYQEDSLHCRSPLEPRDGMAIQTRPA